MFGKDVEELQGDRANNLESLKGRKWDAVIDESASLSSAPDWVKLSSEVLKGSVDQYLFISTRSVYLDTARVPMGADAPVLTRENAPIASELQAAAQRGDLTTSLSSLAESYIHMLVNRLVRSAQRAHELVLYDLLARLYESQMARRGRS